MKSRIVCVAILSVAASQSSHAQFAVTVMPSVIGSVVGHMAAADTEAACMSGTSLPQNEINEARDPAIAVMQQYFASAQSGKAKSNAFHLDSKTHWVAGALNTGAEGIDAATDPLAVEGRTLMPRPLRFYRAGIGAAALGQWVVQDPRGSVVGVYTGMFLRRSGNWRLHDLTISQAGEKVAPAVQFCHVQGDVTKYKLSSSAVMREYAEKRLSKAKAKLAIASQKAELSERKSVAAPTSASRRQQAATDRSVVDQLQQNVKEREAALTTAKQAEENAQKAAHLVEEQTVDATEVMAFSTSS
jgi:hypothetical protein